MKLLNNKNFYNSYKFLWKRNWSHPKTPKLGSNQLKNFQLLLQIRILRFSFDDYQFPLGHIFTIVFVMKKWLKCNFHLCKQNSPASGTRVLPIFKATSLISQYSRNFFNRISNITSIIFHLRAVYLKSPKRFTASTAKSLSVFVSFHLLFVCKVHCFLL